MAARRGTTMSEEDSPRVQGCALFRVVESTGQGSFIRRSLARMSGRSTQSTGHELPRWGDVELLSYAQVRSVGLEGVDINFKFFMDEAYVLQADQIVQSSEGDVLQRELHCIGADQNSLERALEAGEMLRKAYNDDGTLGQYRTVIHAEVMCRESSQFERYYRHFCVTEFLVYFRGKLEGDFTRVSSSSSYRDRLLEISRGTQRQIMRAVEVECDIRSLHSASDFVLDRGTETLSFDHRSEDQQTWAMQTLVSCISIGRSCVAQCSAADPATCPYLNRPPGWSQDARDAEDHRDHEGSPGPRGSISRPSTMYKITGFDEDEGAELQFEELPGRPQLHMDGDIYLVDEGNGHLFIYYYKDEEEDALFYLTAQQVFETMLKFVDFLEDTSGPDLYSVSLIATKDESAALDNLVY